MCPTARLVWQVTRGCELHWRTWDGEHVVYNTGSGDTHLLDSHSAAILKQIQRNSSTTEELGDSFPEAAVYLTELLERLHALALIEPVNP